MFKTGFIAEPYVPVVDSWKMQCFLRICRVFPEVGPDTAALLVLLPREDFRIKSVLETGNVSAGGMTVPTMGRAPWT